MITISSVRDKDHETFKAIERTENIVGALQSLLRFELGFGGTIVSATETQIVTKTIVFACIDVTTFTGPVDEMQFLIEGTAVYATLAHKNISSDIDLLLKNTGGVPLFMTSCGPHLPEILTGRRYSSIAAALIITKDVEKTKELLQYNDNDLYAALGLLYDDKDLQIVV